MGVEKHTTIHATQKLYDECLKYLVFGNVLRNNTYPLSVSAERVFQALAVAEYAKEVKADAVAHGSTGAGNDQVRFDMIFNIMIPEVEVIAPIRDLKLSREAEIEYLKKHGVELDWNKTKYSINQGIWGTSVGGKETLTSNEYLPEEAFPHQLKKNDPARVTLHFEKGELKGIDDKKFDNPVDAIKALSEMASSYAIGRDIHVGDTIVGIKGRVGFEAPAPMIIIKAHHALEKHVLTKWQQYWKDQMGVWYGMMVHEGQFLEPVLRNIEKFLADTQHHVTGKVFVRLEPYRFTVLGIESSYDMMSPEFGTYGEMHMGWSGEDVKGFSKILSNQLKIYNKVKEKNGED
jgi:argininosuccinate synthase